MRLLFRDKDGRYRFTDDLHNPPPYAILSHTWGAKDDELTFADIQNGTGKEKAGYAKLDFIADRAKDDGLEHYWIDTCCIDKSIETELKATIRAMFQYYKSATICYVYLEDLSSNKPTRNGDLQWKKSFHNCRWFTRGWTLQELLAPSKVLFFARGQYIGTRAELCDLIEDATSINRAALEGRRLETFPHLVRMEWSNSRQTTVPEDQIYAQMGVCGVSMNPRYGEGRKEAKRRLDAKIRERYGSSAFEMTANSTINLSRHTSFRSVPDLDQHRDSERLTIAQRKISMAKLRFGAINSRRATIVKAMSSTCSWLLTDETYLSWLAPEALNTHHGFLWIKGKPGAGKSVSVKFLDNHTRSSIDKNDICISFYFNARGEQLEKSLIGMYRSLLVQLLDAAPELQSVLSTAVLELDDTDACHTQIMAMMQTAVAGLGDRKLFMFIDALDECHDGDVQQMINCFRDLCWDALDDGVTIRICFASRHYPIVKVPTGLQLVLEELDEHTKDLATYLDESLDIDVPEQKEKIKEDVLSKSSGIFLWIILVTKILDEEFRDGRIHAVEQRLSELPRGLSHLFSNILTRDNKNLKESLLCIKWILYAKRPLDLPEFYFAMMSGLKQSTIWINQKTEDMFRFMLSSSKGLAELSGGKNGKVQFIHESVRDYLILADGLKHLQRDHSAAQDHEMLKHCCYEGLRVIEDGSMMSQPVQGRSVNGEDWKPPSNDTLKHRKSIAERTPFFEYAVRHLLYHSDQAQPSIPQCDFLKSFNLRAWRRKCNLMARYNTQIYGRDLDLVYICAERNYANLLSLLHCEGEFMNQVSSSRYRFPLFAAIANASKAAARFLLWADGAEDPDSIVQEIIVDKLLNRAEYDKYNGEAMWLWALRHGYDRLCVHFMQKMTSEATHGLGSHVDGKWPLHLAAEHNCSRATEYLVELERSSVDVKHLAPDSPPTSLLIAAARSHHVIIDTLLEADADPNIGDEIGRTALHFAAAKKDPDIAEALLNAGADIDAQDSRGYTALHYALYAQPLLNERLAYSCSPDQPLRYDFNNFFKGQAVANLLLDRGAQKKLPNCTLRPFPEAVRTGCYDLADRLLRTIDTGEKWLDMSAMERPCYQLESPGIKKQAEILLAAGYHPDKLIAYDQSSPRFYTGSGSACPLLIWAILAVNADLLDLLLENGASMSVHFHGEDARKWAYLKGIHAIFDVLAKHGIEMDRTHAAWHIQWFFAKAEFAKMKADREKALATYFDVSAKHGSKVAEGMMDDNHGVLGR